MAEITNNASQVAAEMKSTYEWISQLSKEACKRQVQTILNTIRGDWDKESDRIRGKKEIPDSWFGLESLSYKGIIGLENPVYPGVLAEVKAYFSFPGLKVNLYQKEEDVICYTMTYTPPAEADEEPRCYMGPTSESDEAKADSDSE